MERTFNSRSYIPIQNEISNRPYHKDSSNSYRTKGKENNPYSISKMHKQAMQNLEDCSFTEFTNAKANKSNLVGNSSFNMSRNLKEKPLNRLSVIESGPDKTFSTPPRSQRQKLFSQITQKSSQTEEKVPKKIRKKKNEVKLLEVWNFKWAPYQEFGVARRQYIPFQIQIPYESRFERNGETIMHLLDTKKTRDALQELDFLKFKEIPPLVLY